MTRFVTEDQLEALGLDRGEARRERHARLARGGGGAWPGTGGRGDRRHGHPQRQLRGDPLRGGLGAARRAARDLDRPGRRGSPDPQGERARGDARGRPNAAAGVGGHPPGGPRGPRSARSRHGAARPATLGVRGGTILLPSGDGLLIVAAPARARGHPHPRRALSGAARGDPLAGGRLDGAASRAVAPGRDPGAARARRCTGRTRWPSGSSRGYALASDRGGLDPRARRTSFARGSGREDSGRPRSRRWRCSCGPRWSGCSRRRRAGGDHGVRRPAVARRTGRAVPRPRRRRGRPYPPERGGRRRRPSRASSSCWTRTAPASCGASRRPVDRRRAPPRGGPLRPHGVVGDARDGRGLTMLGAIQALIERPRLDGYIEQQIARALRRGPVVLAHRGDSAPGARGELAPDGPPRLRPGQTILVTADAGFADLWALDVGLGAAPTDGDALRFGSAARATWDVAIAALPRALPVLWSSVGQYQDAWLRALHLVLRRTTPPRRPRRRARRASGSSTGRRSGSRSSSRSRRWSSTMPCRAISPPRAPSTRAGASRPSAGSRARSRSWPAKRRGSGASSWRRARKTRRAPPAAAIAAPFQVIGVDDGGGRDRGDARARAHRAPGRGRLGRRASTRAERGILPARPPGAPRDRRLEPGGARRRARARTVAGDLSAPRSAAARVRRSGRATPRRQRRPSPRSSTRAGSPRCRRRSASRSSRTTSSSRRTPASRTRRW